MPVECTMPVTACAEPRLLADRILALLDEHGVPPTPGNYRVIYEYLSGTNASLQHDVARYLDQKRKLDETVLSLWHERHIATDQFGMVHGMGTNLEKIAGEFMAAIGETSGIAARFGSRLECGIRALTDDTPESSRRTAIVEMAGAAREAQAESHRLLRVLEVSRDQTREIMRELEQRRREALVDPLTGLFNRRAMEAHFTGVIALRADQPVAVLAIDIDHFKAINDAHGHAVGDSVIRNVAQLIRKSIRGNDFAVRFGGEEFVVILANTSALGAMTVAETIRHRIQALRLKRTRDGQAIEPITASIGVAEMMAEDTAETVVNRADDALYAAKSNGRNAVVLAADAFLHS